MPSRADVQRACETAVLTKRADVAHSEIAFFGGSFTAIPGDIMVSLLDAASVYVKGGHFKGIRISTRPDAVDDEMLRLLKSYAVTAIELGAQSMDDRVLAANHRGHTAGDVEKASAAIHAAGIELGLQMMTGLYQSSQQADYETAKRLAALHPATMRIYPTLVMEHTTLAVLYRAGKYVPPTLEGTVRLCAELLGFFEQNRIRVIRLGLHAGSEMQSRLLAGPWHPALRELCEGLLLYEKAMALLQRQIPGGGKVTLAVHPREVSKMKGQKCGNIQKFKQAGYDVKVIASRSVEIGGIQFQPDHI
jgi:histone acetyltransferase (RNA polymerase elongator complex component)